MQKLYYSISEVSTIVDEEQHILRYWEKEFDGLKPKKNRGGNRIYSHKDLLILRLIKKLIRSDKLSLKGAKEQLNKFLKQDDLNLEKFSEFPVNTMDKRETTINPESIKSNKEVPLNELVTKSELKELALLLEDTLSFLKSN